MPLIPPVNRLIASLPRKDRQGFLEGCERVELSFAEVLAQPGQRLRHVYFPIDCAISQMTPISERASLEVGLLGNEGMLGSWLLLGVNASPLHAMVQCAGTALRMTAAQFGLQLARSASLKQQLNRYLYTQMDQLAQVALCTRFHVVEARLARWLLMTRDRAGSDNFQITHELLASALGVRRVGVTKAASSLQKSGLISYSRGNVTILDPRGLESASCECYEADKAAYARIMGPDAAAEAGA